MLLKVSTARNRVVFMTDAVDHVTGKASLTLTVTASKDGAAFGSISPSVTDLGNGFYNLALTTSHTDTKGDLAVHITGTGADPTDFIDQVLTDLPGDSVSSVTGAVGSVTGAVGSVSGNVVGSVGSVTGLTASNLDTTVSSRLASGSYTAPPSAATIGQAVWDVLVASLSTANSIGKFFMDNWTAARATKIDNLDAAVSTKATQASVDKIRTVVKTIQGLTGE
jgi:hypothetical protein